MNAPMRLVFVVCEGQTEETFVGRVLSPTFYPQLNLIAQTIETSVGHKGGALVYERVRKHLRNTLRQSNNSVVTTLFDLYRLDTHFPGFMEARSKPLEQRLATLTSTLHQDIIEFTGCSPDRFIPYIQPYEFEALLFSDVQTLVGVEAGWAGAASALEAIRNAAETPEHINDRPESKPAAHLERHLTQPAYRKALDGPRAAERIGLPKIMEQCHHFADWVRRLREIPPS